MANDANFTPGMPVWVIERDEDGNVIASSRVNGYDFDDILAYHVQRTAEDYDTQLCVFPDEDYYVSKKDCEADFVAEQEAEDGKDNR